MKIDRHNYEEFFILYLDNELSPAERFEVEAFAKMHPDLQEELDILLQSKLVPDEHIVFEGKDELLSFSNNSISLSNYEEWLVLYIDDELSAEQGATVVQFAAAHPHVQSELNLLLQTKSAPAYDVVFPGKESLYRREEKTRPVIWWRMAAAAAVLIAVSTTIVLVNKTRDTAGSGSEDIVSTDPAKTNLKDNNIQLTTPNNTNTTTPAIQNNRQADDQQKISKEQPAIVSVTKQANRKERSAATANSSVKKNEPVITDHTPQQMISESTLAAITTDKGRTTTINADQPTPLTIQSEIIQPPSVTTRKVQPLYASTPSEPGIGDNDGKKSRLRGFLRKVTRTFEKQTNIDATDDDDRLLVGGLAIKLK